MKIKVQLGLLIATVLLAVSCQKEIEDTIGNSGTGSGGTGGGSSTGAYLDSIASISGTERSDVKITYDANKRIQRFITKGTSNGLPTEEVYVVDRNAAGNVANLFYYELEDRVRDTTRLRATYSAGKLFSLHGPRTEDGQLARFDSIVFAYNASGYLAKRSYYIDEGAGYELLYVEEMTYTGFNLSSIKIFEDVGAPTGALELIGTGTMTYDSRTAAYSPSVEEHAMGVYESFARNNVTRYVLESVGSSTPAVDLKLTYTYGANGRPATSIGREGTDPNPVIQSTYFYKN